MTKLLQEAFERAKRLCPEAQDFIAHLVIEELDAEQRWDELIARSSDKLETLAERALEANRRGETETADPDQL